MKGEDLDWGVSWRHIVLRGALSYDSAGQECASLYKTIQQNSVITVKEGLQSQLRLKPPGLTFLHFQVNRTVAFKRKQEKGADRK